MLGSALFLISRYGLAGAGAAWVAGNALAGVVALVVLRREPER